LGYTLMAALAVRLSAAAARTAVPAARRRVAASVAGQLQLRAWLADAPGGASAAAGGKPSLQAAMHEQEKNISVLQTALKEAISAGKLETAARLAADAKAATLALYGRNHPASAAAINNEALVAKQAGDLDRALELYGQALALYEKLVGKTHLSYAATLANIGLLHCELARGGKGVDALAQADTAKGYLEHALHIRAGELPADNPLLAVTRYQLASALRLGKRYGEAERLLVAAVADLRRTLGDRHPSTATALNNLGFLLKETGAFDRAEDAYAEAAATREAVLGENHADTITALHNLAECRRAGGNEAGALEVQDRILGLLRVYDPAKADAVQAAMTEAAAAAATTTPPAADGAAGGSGDARR
jgi:tetratricopeptide (TPR) repeat protein